MNENPHWPSGPKSDCYARGLASTPLPNLLGNRGGMYVCM